MARRFALGLVLAVAACRIEPEPGAPLTQPDGIDEPGSDMPSSDSGGGRVSSGSSAGGDAARGGGEAPGGAADTTGGGDEPPPGACTAEDVTLDEVRAEAVLSGLSVALQATATSQKFLLSQTQAGSCLWGAFVGDAPRTGEPRGVLVISYGDEAPGGARCAPGTDALPDDLEPGDRVRAVGRASSFAPAACGDLVAEPQLVADARCPVERLGRATPVEPSTLPLEVADELARGSNPELVRRWAGGLVRLESVSALPNETGDGAVRPYGVMALAETALEVHADIEYGDLSAGGPRDASKGLDFSYPTAFRSITGLVYLDYCTYALAPRKRCADFEPPSNGCR